MVTLRISYAKDLRQNLMAKHILIAWLDQVKEHHIIECWAGITWIQADNHFDILNSSTSITQKTMEAEETVCWWTPNAINLSHLHGPVQLCTRLLGDLLLIPLMMIFTAPLSVVMSIETVSSSLKVLKISSTSSL